MLRKKILLSVASLVLVLNSLNVVASVPTNSSNDNVWSNIEGSYYARERATVFNLTDDDILMGSEVDSSTITKLYTSENLNTLNGINNFVSVVKQNGLIRSLEDTNTYLATVQGVADPTPGTAIICNNSVTQVIEADQGSMYRLDLDSSAKTSLSASKLALSETSAYFIVLDGFMSGIVFDDGNTEMIQILSSYKDILEDGKIYNLQDILVKLEENKDILTKFETKNANLDSEKAVITLG